ncbi:MAG: O-antigen ligase family protein [Phycisphaerae bacterium]
MTTHTAQPPDEPRGRSPAVGVQPGKAFPWWLPAGRVQWRHDSQFFHYLGTFGYPFHLWLGVLWCALVVGPMATVELGAIAVGVCFLARLPFVWRGLWDALRQPAVIFLGLWCVWGWVLTARSGWSADALHEMSFQRWAYAFVVLWAVMDNRRLLVVGLAVGFVLAQLAQLGEFFGYRFGIDRLVWSHPPAPDPAARISGWWHQPAIGGAMLVACLGLHLGPALFGRGRVRVIAIVASGATVVALLATGTRGAWVAAAGLVGAVLVLGVVAAMTDSFARGDARLRDGATVLGRGGVLRQFAVLVGVVAVVVGAIFLVPQTRSRVSLLVTEVRDVLTRDDLDSDMGGRVLAAKAAVDAIAKHPVAGVGPGGFHAHVQRYATEKAITIAPHRLEKLKTAHNTFLHTAATQGLVGAVLLYAGLVCAIWGGLRPRTVHGVPVLRQHLGSYAAAPAIALLGMVIVGAFESTPVNTSTGALSTVLIALCGWVRAREG